MTEEKERLGYALGLNIAKNLKEQGFEGFDLTAFTAAMDDYFATKELKMSVPEVNEALQNAMARIQAEKHGPVLEEGKKFLEENAKREEVLVTESGLQYRVMKEGSGKSPSPTDQVTTHYHGKLIDGKVFDSSVNRGTPATFPVNGVIQGWQEALPMMKEGDKWELFIPYDLAYGENGAGGAIPPFATLIFEVELISVN
ncbi:MAG: FKBP-type peptidyl-prolyl cis-trans isomerase [Flavobacteriales bacterium]|nr:FKBP-type peptidyl-prolyl cis-trans isomerase [Flavobacteriales bacterium]